MARPIWCRHKECAGREPHISEQGVLPAVCPTCNRAGHWATVPDATPPLEKFKKSARQRFELSENDRKFLRSIRILQE